MLDRLGTIPGCVPGRGLVHIFSVSFRGYLYTGSSLLQGDLRTDEVRIEGSWTFPGRRRRLSDSAFFAPALVVQEGSFWGVCFVYCFCLHINTVNYIARHFSVDKHIISLLFI